MFLNRTHELDLLQRWWEGDQPELITMYGRRQVGKTELLVHFIAGRPAIYFYADRQLVGDHLRASTEQVLAPADALLPGRQLPRILVSLCAAQSLGAGAGPGAVRLGDQNPASV
jgi:AAA+ ATPase superfamily predicted ATPase